MWRLHRYKFIFSLLLLVSGLLMAIAAGSLKPSQLFDPLDILGEGTTLLVATLWLGLIVSSRPAGPVTDWLYYGSLLLMYSYFLDLLDEFIRYPDTLRLMSWLESLPAPVGMLLLTYGLVGWHREQRAINRQLRGRELFLRDHHLIDPLTQLYGADYLHGVLSREIELHRAKQQPLALLLLDINNFAAFNRLYGIAAGDEYLSQLAELLSNQLRHSDVICRYSGDRFVVLLPDTTEKQAHIMAQHIQQHLHLLSKDNQPQLTLVYQNVTQQNANAALQDAITAITKARQPAPLQVQNT